MAEAVVAVVVAVAVVVVAVTFDSSHPIIIG